MFNDIDHGPFVVGEDIHRLAKKRDVGIIDRNTCGRVKGHRSSMDGSKPAFSILMKCDGDSATMKFERGRGFGHLLGIAKASLPGRVDAIVRKRHAPSDAYSAVHNFGGTSVVRLLLFQPKIFSIAINSTGLTR
jgi:hypothetical protein